MKKRIMSTLKKILKQEKVLNTFIAVTQWQYSSSTLLRFISNMVTAPLYILFKSRYYRLLMLLRCYKSERSKTIQVAAMPLTGYLPEKLLTRLITDDKTVTADEYEKYLLSASLEPSLQLDWSKQMMMIGRLDIARAGFIELANRKSWQVSSEMRLECLRYAGVTSFLFSKNSDAVHYFKLTGQYRRILYQPTTPRNYRILGPGWFSALGHVCILDYFLKYIKLYGDVNTKIVFPCTIDQAPGQLGQFVLNKFTTLGVHIVHPDDLEEDYNAWANANNYPEWSKLLSTEKAAMVDDCWDFNFNDGESLCFVHAHARIQKEWEQGGHAPLFVLTDSEKEWIADYLAILGVPKVAWYVCLHVREPGFHSSWDKMYPSMRDANIDDYHLAIETIVKAGGWVIRMGDSSMKPLPAMRNVIDYAHSSMRTPTADVLLLAGSRFFIGTNSGYVNICSMYYVPCALTNWAPLGWTLSLHHDLISPKLLRYKLTGEYVTLEKMYQSELVFVSNWSELPVDIELVPNTPEELAAVTEEMMVECARPSHDKVLLSSIEQSYYERIAKAYGGYTGPRLAQSFVRAHKDVFAPPKTEVCEAEKTFLSSDTVMYL